MPDKSRPRGGGRWGRPVRNVQPKTHDPYALRLKPGDALVCDDCGVVLHGGRWYWGAPPLGDERRGVCPACRRVRDRYPAGTLRLHGVPAAERADTIAMIRNVAEQEKQAHPLERLMAIEEQPDEVVVTTTGLHAARRIAAALQRRFHQGLSVRYLQGESLVQIEWSPP